MTGYRADRSEQQILGNVILADLMPENTIPTILVSETTIFCFVFCFVSNHPDSGEYYSTHFSVGNCDHNHSGAGTYVSGHYHLIMTLLASGTMPGTVTVFFNYSQVRACLLYTSPSPRD